MLSSSLLGSISLKNELTVMLWVCSGLPIQSIRAHAHAPTRCSATTQIQEVLQHDLISTS
jgi:hypothetical protein